MPKYNVDVYRIGQSTNTISVEADSEETAKYKAMELVDDYEWEDHDVDWDIRGVEEED